MGVAAWLFFVGGVICLVNAVNGRDRNLLISHTERGNASHRDLLEETKVGVSPYLVFCTVCAPRAALSFRIA